MEKSSNRTQQSTQQQANLHLTNTARQAYEVGGAKVFRAPITHQAVTTQAGRSIIDSNGTFLTKSNLLGRGVHADADSTVKASMDGLPDQLGATDGGTLALAACTCGCTSASKTRETLVTGSTSCTVIVPDAHLCVEALQSRSALTRAVGTGNS